MLVFSSSKSTLRVVGVVSTFIFFVSICPSTVVTILCNFVVLGYSVVARLVPIITEVVEDDNFGLLFIDDTIVDGNCVSSTIFRSVEVVCCMLCAINFGVSGKNDVGDGDVKDKLLFDTIGKIISIEVLRAGNNLDI